MQDTTVQAVEHQIQSLVQQMTLPEKIGQMTQVEKNSLQPEDVATYFLGSVLSGGGGNPVQNSPQTWAQMVHEFQQQALKTRLRIPLVYGVDAVHGHNNVKGAVIFPHNIGLGATYDADLIYRIAQATARELLATGVHWNFAPTVAIPQDIRWGRTYEGFSQDTAIVQELGTAYVRGLQDEGVMPSVKHYIADGGTAWGSSRRYEWLTGNWQAPDNTFTIDQGNAEIDEAVLRQVHLPPYQAAIEAGALNVMVSFSSWNGQKMHAHKYLLTDVLKDEMGFNGFIVSDWMAINQIDPDFYTCVVTSINAGLDMIMVPFDFKTFIATLTKAVENGDVSVERIDDAVTRILRAKFWLGLFENPFGNFDLLPQVGSVENRQIAREAVRKSLVLLKNENNLLPLRKNTPYLLIAGLGANNIGMQCGGWSIEWQGGNGSITPGTSILDAIQNMVSEDTEVVHNPTAENAVPAPVGIVVVGETPYAEGIGDRAELTLSSEDTAVIQRMRSFCEKLIVILLSGRPLIINDAIESADAFIAAWLPGTEGDGVADVLFGDYPFTGRLSFAWPRSMAQVPLDALKRHPDQPLFNIGSGL